MQLDEVFAGVFKNLCPSCMEGKVYKSTFQMNKVCPTCHLKFERESGYFLGAVSFAYGIGLFLVIPILLTLLFAGYSKPVIAGVPSIVAIACIPFLMRLTRLAWMHMDFRNNPPDSKEFIQQ